MKRLPEKRWISFWRHFFNRERTEQELTTSMMEWQEKWNWDFVKINPPACYHVLDWGAEYEFFDDPLREPELRMPVIETVDDINKIQSIDVNKGMLGAQLKVIRNLRNHFGPDLPLLETIFSPIEIAHRLMPGREALFNLIRSAPNSVHKLLEVITGVFREFAVECTRHGADGIFFATKWASSDWLTWTEYLEFGKEYEMQVLEPLADSLLVLHVCGENTHLRQMLDYPVDIFSYDFFAQGAPAAYEVAEQTGRFVLGGVSPDWVAGNQESIVEAARQFSEIDRWLIGPSCVLPVTTKDQDLAALTAALQAL